MNIVVDIGNSRVKVGYFQSEELLAVDAFAHPDYPGAVLQSQAWQQFSPHSKYLGLVSVGNPEMVKATEILLKANPDLEFRRIDRDSPLPIGNRYGSRQTLGMDRICAAVAGYQRAGRGPVLVIVAGTAITYEYVDASGDYRGGAISPGLKTRFRALHEFTAALPLIPIEGDLPWVGDSTETCIRSGVVHGLVSEIEGFIAHYSGHSSAPLPVYLTGGDATYLGNQVKSPTFADPNLLLYGINALIRYHA